MAMSPRDVLELPSDKRRRTRAGLMSAEEILSRPAHERKRMHRLYKRARTYHRDHRKQYSRDELVDFLRRRGFRSKRQLERERVPGEPRLYDYRKEFKTWECAKIAAFGPPEKPLAEFDARYMLKLIVEHGLWSAREYNRARKLRPDVLPSMSKVLREFRNWNNLKICARRSSAKVMFDEYLKLMRKLGRTPTSDECLRAGIALDKAMALFRGKREFDRFMRDLEAHNA